MPTQIIYRPKLDHLQNYVAATEIELRRLLERAQDLQRQIATAHARRDELLRAYGRPVTSPLQPEAYPARSLPREIITLNQTLARLEQALADLRRQIQDQRAAVDTARRALARYQAQPAGPPAREVERDARPNFSAR
jgi:predicted  nucleic acid-binding Zn-ribbon protein